MKGNVVAAPIFGFLPSHVDLAATIRLIATPPPAGIGPQAVITANLDHVVQLRRSPAFQDAYRHAALIVCDGFPVEYYARLRGHPVQRVTGTDLLEGLLGQPGVDIQRPIFVVDSPATANAVENWAAARGCTAAVASHVPPYGFIDDDIACENIVIAAAMHRTRLLVMAVGSPHSEIFIDRYRAILPDCWALSVGQAVKTALGLARRAPVAVRALHAEWLWRVAHEPRRLCGRYGFGAIRFLEAVAADLRGGAP